MGAHHDPNLFDSEEEFSFPGTEIKDSNVRSPMQTTTSTVSAISIAFWAISATAANAAGPDWGTYIKNVNLINGNDPAVAN